LKREQVIVGPRSNFRWNRQLDDENARRLQMLEAMERMRREV